MVEGFDCEAKEMIGGRQHVMNPKRRAMWVRAMGEDNK